MKKVIFTGILFCIAILAFSLSGRSMNEGESDVIIVTRNFGSLIISYGNDKSEIIDLKSAPSDKSIIYDNNILIKELNTLRSQGYEIKSTISSQYVAMNSFILEKK